MVAVFMYWMSRNHVNCTYYYTDNQATTPFGDCPGTAFLPFRPHCVKARQNRCQEDLKSWKTRGDHQDALVLRGWRLSSRTWNPITSPWMKQLTWLRIVHSGDWCLRLVLHSPSGACQKWWPVHVSHQDSSLLAVKMLIMLLVLVCVE